MFSTILRKLKLWPVQLLCDTFQEGITKNKMNILGTFLTSSKKITECVLLFIKLACVL